MSAAVALQTLIFQTLISDAGVGALVGERIYDNIPKEAAFPYVSFGPTQEITDDDECIDGEEHYVQIDVWDRSQGRLRNAKFITDAVKVALHRADLSLPDPYALLLMEVTQKRVMRDADGITAHGILTVRALVEI